MSDELGRMRDAFVDAMAREWADFLLESFSEDSTRYATVSMAKAYVAALGIRKNPWWGAKTNEAKRQPLLRDVYETLQECIYRLGAKPPYGDGWLYAREQVMGLLAEARDQYLAERVTNER